MAKHLTGKDIAILINLIDSWDGKLGWETLCDAVAPLIGARPTRQTLSSHSQVKAAFGQKKQQQKNGFVATKRPASLSIAEQRIKRLESENDRLKLENSALLDRFLRWQYNAYKYGISKEELDSGLPTIDRR
ncbi:MULTISPECIES: hypothetical protein [Pseudomonas]|uniref:hypothetical protein n=1 Tax=Pseudomonas TaxID=286 RepID=UPI000CF6EF40|nr:MULTISPECIES: hypothetical protein [Pseudomonas]AVJ40385.1 hypothetical protein CLM75_24715 [Pseudomonas lurida]PRA14634.1 hypothetical protein CQ002_20005 [Pseudomonas sp. MYb13]PRA21393.1 hypothetical protein CQ004_14110 [Pseudomonas lurida]PRA36097.1 hypothetical protein CQ005_10205 [Pseudomonas lurida]PRC01204.1 hypothetical protein CQ014_11835 [Pseudomonas lurida]